MSFKKMKRSMLGHKGYCGIVIKAFEDLINQEPAPSLEAVERSFGKVQERYDKIFSALDLCTTALYSDDTVDETQLAVEQKDLLNHQESFLKEQNKVEHLYSTFKFSNSKAEPVIAPPVAVSRPTVKLTALSPPKWNGIKADFYTWRSKFRHIMWEAQVQDEMTQLCYLQSPGVLPEEFQLLVSDCSTMTEVWSRLEERVPKSTIRHEVIARLRNVPSLPARRSVAALREFANEISLFCRRMADLEYTKENYTCIILQDVYERLDQNTALRYRSQIDLQRSLGVKVEEELDGLCAFLRAEATTLEMTIGSSSSSIRTVNFVSQDTSNSEMKCDCGTTPVHNMVDCQTFVSMSIGKRRDLLKTSLRCFLCLAKYHLSRDCTSGLKCTVCEGNHHRLLCTSEAQAPNLSCAFGLRTPSGQVKPKDFAPMVIVEVENKKGDWVKARCFLDNGSNASLIRMEFAQENHLQPGEEGKVSLEVAGGRMHSEPSEEYGFRIRPIGGTESYFISTSGMAKPCSDVRPVPKTVFSAYKHLQPVQDLVYLEGGKVDILVGRDYSPLLSEEKVLRASDNADDFPSAAFTRLGCYLFGGLTKGDQHVVNHIEANFVNRTEEKELQSFLYGDILGVRPTSLCVCTDNEISESRFIKHVQESTSMDNQGRVVVQMPWAQGYPDSLPSPNNFYRAKDQMLRREVGLERNGNLAAHNNEIQMLVQAGAVVKFSREDSWLAMLEPGWFLDNYLIERNGKPRLVWNSAATYKGVCLNDAFEKGPSLTNSLFNCLLKMREGYVAATGDIEKMFTQVAIAEKDRRYHRFIWRDGIQDSPIYVYQWQRLLFGNKPSPDLATYALHYLADKASTEYPRGTSALKNETYVDDIGFSNDDSCITAQGIREVDAILGKGRFRVKVWNSNDPELDKNVEEKVSDFLGHEWNKRSDSLSLKCKPTGAESEGCTTKRGALGCVARIWDPLGVVLPVSIQYRMDFQQLWEKGYGWDEALPEDLVEVWKAHAVEMQQLQNVELERCLKPADAIGLPQLHAFSDGGNSAFGTCIFIRWETPKGIEFRFVAAKAFVAPLKRKSIPRVELMGAVAMSRLVQEVMKSLCFNFKFTRFWIDSAVVLYWLLSDSSRYKPFVSTRVQEFQDTHPNWKEELRYVPSKHNPADCLTKSIPIDSLPAWHKGEYSAFLRQDEQYWDFKVDQNSLDADGMKSFLETKPTRCSKLMLRKVVCAIALDEAGGEVDEPGETFGRELAGHYSEWRKIIYAVAFMIRSLRNRSFSSGPVTPKDVNEAENVLFRMCQEDLKEDLDGTAKRFVKYQPFLDTLGLLRAQGRLRNTKIDEELKHPIFLPSEHPLVHLFLRHYHCKLLHQGYRVVSANVTNEGYLVVGAKEGLKSIANKCLFCRVRRRKLLQQRMGELPAFRLQPRTPPFTSTAMDFFGPLKVKLTRNTSVDGTVLIATCTTTRCIHLELSLLESTDSFLQAWRRFVAVRGVHPVHVFSDGGRNFHGAKPMIEEWIKSWDQDLIRHQFPSTNFEFDWKVNVPLASHMNGVVESLVASVRKGLDASITNYTRRVLSYEHWSTVLAEVSYVVNSRPLYPEGDPWDFHCITANDILHPYGQPNFPHYTAENEGNVKDMFKAVQVRVDVFWETWTKSMPPQLLSRSKWFHSRENIEVGDFVIVFEKGFKGKSAPRATWTKAIVTAVHPSSDGLVRSVTIRDSKHDEYKRPIHKLCLIATRAELEADEV